MRRRKCVVGHIPRHAVPWVLAATVSVQDENADGVIIAGATIRKEGREAFQSYG